MKSLKIQARRSFGEAQVINTATFGVVVLMVIATTLLTPPALKWALQVAKRSRAVKS
jgi:hypothetical protein